MLIKIADLLGPDDLETARDLCKVVSWRDGAETAGKTAREVKRNEQADLSSRMGAKLKDLLMRAISNRSPPKQIRMR